MCEKHLSNDHFPARKYKYFLKPNTSRNRRVWKESKYEKCEKEE